jgi:azurin
MKKVILMASFAIAMVSCGGSKEQTQDTATEATTTEQPATAPEAPAAENATSPAQASNDVTIEATDQMTFSLKEIKVKGGQKVKVTIKHTGTMAKDVMGHNFVLLKPGVDLAAFSQKAIKAKATNYVPDGDPDVIAHTKIVGGGESDTVEFDAPAPGTYEFICSFPGHYSMMKGTFIVE